MLKTIANTSYVFSIVSFAVFVFLVLFAAFTKKSKAAKTGADTEGGAQQKGIVEDASKLVEAAAKLTDALAKVPPSIVSLLAAVAFLLIAAVASGLWGTPAK